ncbi:MAG: NADH-quinone oxidoreductase subunit J [Bryobacterales bacterium]|nr:NADH-quinone oxidoreductase subunit J [Bryobacterales bacterium]MBV9401204.1 NADH-quinone oxidoreductase subunit J [Bryobacterales bacterium]
MDAAFYIASVVAIGATVLTITRTNAVHALLYLILSLLAVAVAFYTMGAPFIAALEVIIYAGAIMVLFIFIVMMLNLGERAAALERRWRTPGMWRGPAILAGLLLIEVAYLLLRAGNATGAAQAVEPKQVAMALFGPYLIGVELSSILLLAGMIGAYHLGMRKIEEMREEHGTHIDEGRVVASGDLVHAGADRADRAP